MDAAVDSNCFSQGGGGMNPLLRTTCDVVAHKPDLNVLMMCNIYTDCYYLLLLLTGDDQGSKSNPSKSTPACRRNLQDVLQSGPRLRLAKGGHRASSKSNHHAVVSICVCVRSLGANSTNRTTNEELPKSPAAATTDRPRTNHRLLDYGNWMEKRTTTSE